MRDPYEAKAAVYRHETAVAASCQDAAVAFERDGASTEARTAWSAALAAARLARDASPHAYGQRVMARHIEWLEWRLSSCVNS